jgi:hypothetical protein
LEAEYGYFPDSAKKLLITKGCDNLIALTSINQTDITDILSKFIDSICNIGFRRTNENLPRALAHKGIEYFVTKMNNFRVDKKSTPAIIQPDKIKTIEEMASHLQNMLCIWLMKNYQIKNKCQREIVVKVPDTNFMHFHEFLDLNAHLMNFYNLQNFF